MDAIPIHTTALPASTMCPSCGERLDGSTGTGIPGPGSITLCVYCRVFLIFGTDRSLARLSNHDWLALPIQTRELLTSMRNALIASGVPRPTLAEVEK